MDVVERDHLRLAAADGLGAGLHEDVERERVQFLRRVTEIAVRIELVDH
jgi:hypothetical protein